MITELTEEQEALLPVYEDRYTKIGLTTDRIDRERAVSIVSDVKEKILSLPQTPIIFFNDPMTAWIACSLFSYEPTNNAAKDNYDQQCVDEIDAVIESIESQVKDNDLISLVKRNKFEILNNGLPSFVWPEIDGNFYSYFFSFYDYMKDELKIELGDDYDTFRQILEISLMYPLDNVCILVDRPTLISTNSNGDLHCGDGPALTYPSFNLYALNGVDMSGAEFVISEKNIDVERVLSIKNAEQRMQAIKLIGLEKFIDQLECETIASLDEYTLLSISMEGISRPYLKMINPSSGEVHIEGIDEDHASTIEQALAWKLRQTKYKRPLAIA